MDRRKAKYSRKPKHEKISLVEKIFIEYPRLTKLLDVIAYCHEYSKVAAEPWCALITGWAGAGKTKLYEYYMQRFPRQITESGTVVAVLSARIPERPSVPKLVTVLLDKLGDPAAAKGNATSQTLRLYHLLKECKVELIILDEFQHFVDWDSLKILKTVSDWLKNLIDETRIPVILIGMPYSDVVLNAVGNSQLKRRFSLRHRLDFFGWQTKAEQDDFRGFLGCLDKQLPLAQSSRLSDPIMAFRFYCATNGVVAYVMKIARRASVLAIERGSQRVELDMLAQAYDELMMPEDPSRKNPFSVSGSQLEIKPFTYQMPVLRATNNRIKAKEKELTASDVLR
jgi:DNA transposition AAA+ family ATPase